MLKRFAVVIFLVGAGSALNASTLDVQASGKFASSDTAGTLVTPGGTFSLSFVVNSATTPLTGTVDSLGFDAPIVDVIYKLNGVNINVTPSEIRFSTLANGGMFDVTFGTGLSAIDFDFQGSQLFGATTTAPTFASGSFAESGFTYSDPANYDVETPSNAVVTVVPTPEPASLSLLLSAFAAASVAVASRKSRWAR